MLKKVFLWLLLIFWCGLIFFFSSQPAGESSALSFSFASFFTDLLLKIKEIGFPVFSQLEDAHVLEFVTSFEVLLRKFAHFFIFSQLGISSSCLAFSYPLHKKKIFTYSFLFCILYAISDEFHQHFVAGRAPQVYDVLIDSSGALLGILIVFIFKKNK